MIIRYEEDKKQRYKTFEENNIDWINICIVIKELYNKDNITNISIKKGDSIKR